MRRKRPARAKNKIQGSLENSLIKAEPKAEHFSEAPRSEARTTAIVVRRSGLFNAELEEAIDIIARERVYRAMLAAMGRRLLLAPSSVDHDDANRQ